MGLTFTVHFVVVPLVMLYFGMRGALTKYGS